MAESTGRGEVLAELVGARGAAAGGARVRVATGSPTGGSDGRAILTAAEPHSGGRAADVSQARRPGGPGPRPVRPVGGAPAREARRAVRALRRGEVMVPGSRDDQRGQGGLATGDIASAGGGIAPVLRAEPVGPARPGAGVRAVSPRRYAVRRAGAAAVLGGLSLLVVVALGSVAEASSAARARASVPAGTATVAVQAGDTVWEVARRAAPTADPAAVVERIVADNGLGGPGAGVLPAGMVLRVPA